MRTNASLCLMALALAAGGFAQPVAAAEGEGILPAGTRAVWDLGKAQREASPTRERVCINGLWRWQPADGRATAIPTGGWGYFKVPGSWPGIGNYMQKDSQTVHSHPAWKDVKMAEVAAAWYEREIIIPQAWTGRRITVSADYINSYAIVFVDGKKAGELGFPGGELDLTSACRPGSRQLLSMRVLAMPLKQTMLSFNDSNSAHGVKGSVARRGLCGDVYLNSTPAGPRIADSKIDTSVRTWEITASVNLAQLAAKDSYVLRARVTDGARRVQEFRSRSFGAKDLVDGRLSFTHGWHPEKLWDIHTPGNLYQLTVSLLGPGDAVLDRGLPIRFGFREFWIDGRDFYLNGTRLFLSAIPFDNAQVSAGAATYEAALETMKRMQTFGINFVYTHNYDCNPGSYLGFAEILRAADDAGMLVALSQPHFGHYDWKAPDAEATNGYAGHAAFFVRAAQDHPSVVAYSTSHNACGYADDMNPQAIDGLQNPRDQWSQANARKALRAEAIIKRIDPARIVYHHSSGNLGSMHTANFYPNFVPIQELSDWFEHWATEGVKPVFTVEYAAPFPWDFAMYRGWYHGARSFGSAVVPWELCLAEWNAQFFGDQAYALSEVEKTCLRWEAKQFRAGRLWHRWDYPHEMGSRDFGEQYPAMAMYTTDNWRAFRTWGMSANSPWSYAVYWQLRDGVDRSRKEIATDWDNLQRPGFSPDYVEGRFERMVTAFEFEDWVPTVAAKALLRNNMPLLAYIAGEPGRFTSKDHVFHPGDTVEKQLIIINNSRQTVACDGQWTFSLPQAQAGREKLELPTGEQKRIPLRFRLPDTLKTGQYTLAMTTAFSTGEKQDDTFTVRVVPRPAEPKPPGRIALFDPEGETGALLRGMGLRCETVSADADLSPFAVLVIGRRGLTVDGPSPDVSRVTQGLHVVVFEQTAAALEKRLGFRVVEYGLRQVFRRLPDHPVLAGIDEELLRDWRGEATLLPPQLEYEKRPGEVPEKKWCGIDIKRLWRAGCRGNVASVLIEKPGRGDFMPIVDGGYSLQYSPLLEYREGKGMVLFCQLDVTARSIADPVAETVLRSIMRYVSEFQPRPRRRVLYAGKPAGKRHLDASGFSPTPFAGGALSPDRILVVGSGGEKVLSSDKGSVAAFLKAGGNLLALGLDEEQANAFLPWRVEMTRAEHIASVFKAPGTGSLLAGVGSPDVHNRDPRELPLVARGAAVAGNGILAAARDAHVVFYQLPPYELTGAQGAIPSLVTTTEDAPEGKRCALATMGTTTGQDSHLGQKVQRAGQRGKTYTFAALVRAVGEPVRLHLELERAGKPWDRLVKAEDVVVGPDQWTEIHTTFAVTKDYPEGWQGYIACRQDGAQFKADRFRLYEGAYVPWHRNGARGKERPNLFAKAGFEEGVGKPWSFSYQENRNLRRTYRRASFTVNRLLANMGAGATTPLLANLSSPAGGKGQTTGSPLIQNADLGLDEDRDGIADSWGCNLTGEGATREREEIKPGSGRWSQRLSCPRPDAKGKSGAMLYQLGVPVIEDQWYRISLLAKSEGMDGTAPTLAISQTGPWQSLLPYQRFVPGRDWKRFTFVVKGKGTEARKTRLQIWHSGTGTVWYADIRMQAIAPPDQGRWLESYYVDVPEDWDDPYRFFRW